MNVVYYELHAWSVMNMVCYEHGLLWTWSVINMVVCYERGLLWFLWTGLLWTLSLTNVVSYECGGLLWTGLLWTGLFWRGLLWMWSVMNVVCYERSLLWTWSVMTWSVMSGLLWAGLFWTDTAFDILDYRKKTGILRINKNITFTNDDVVNYIIGGSSKNCSGPPYPLIRL